MAMINSYLDIKQKIKEKALACGRKPDDIGLIAVSKNFPVEDLQLAYQAGMHEFGESRVQEFLQKKPLLPADCNWHLIGTLQPNKVSKVISHFQLIHSVDNPILARKISLASQEKGIITPILLQVNTSGEKTKYGLSGEEWYKALDAINQLESIRVEGLMTIAPYTDDQKIIRSCFHRLYLWRETWRSSLREPNHFQHLSMGMSQDFLIAIEEGATLLRIGSAIFGTRPN